MATATSASFVEGLTEPTPTAYGPPNSQITPFVIPPDCPRGWKVESDATSSWLHLKPADIRQSCMPYFDDGLSSRDPFGPTPLSWDGTFEFEPAVCPSDWTAYDIATTSTSMKDAGWETFIHQITTAYCCPRGFTLTPGAQIGMTKACAQTFTAGGPAANISVISMPNRAHSGPSTKTFEYGEVVQPAWHLLWTTPNVLEPAMPTPNGAETIATWIPPVWTPPASTASSATGRRVPLSTLEIGQDPNWKPTFGSTPPTESEGKDDWAQKDGGDTRVVWFLRIGLPIIICFLLAGCCAWWYCRTKASKQKKKIMAKQRTQQEAENGVVAADGGEANVLAYVAAPAYTQYNIVEPPPTYTPSAKKMDE